MVYTKFFSKKLSTEKSTGIIFFLVLLFGGFCGVTLSFFQCTASYVSLPTLQQLSCVISKRQIVSLIATDSVFSILLLLCSISGHKKAFFLVLFFLKGFCISYFIFLFVFFFRAQGFLIAFSVLLLHSFLLLPLQLTTAYFMLNEHHSDHHKTGFPFLCASNLAAALVCAVLEYYLLPAILNSHIRL